MKYFMENNAWQALRLSLSFIMLWAFFDKFFGLGFATESSKSWLSGVSPTSGFLQFVPDGLFAPVFNSLSGNIFIDFMFMGGLFLVGLCLLLGIGIKIASYSGALIMLLIYLSLFKEIQPWYFLNLLILIPFFPKLISSFNIFFAGLLLSYFPFIYFGDWGVSSNIRLKHWIIISFFVINLSYLFVYNFNNAKKSHR